MDKKYQYRQKNVHDINVSDMLVRLWSARGPDNRQGIERAFLPLARTGFVHPYVALMPDWHPGKDAVVGSVVPTSNMLLPQVIGGDIGCGMCAVRLPFVAGDLADKFAEIAEKLRAVIPVGTAHNALVSDRVRSNPLWERELRAPISNRTLRKLVRQFASLGGGNHFLEIQADNESRFWIMLHSGSRYLGVDVRDYYVAEGAKQHGIDPKRYGRIPHIIAETELGMDYLQDIQSVRDFARESRKEMMLRTLEVVSGVASGLDTGSIMAEAIEISHNYVAQEEHFGERLFVHRKGAIHLDKGQFGLVPGSMGTNSYVVEGRGNEFGFSSCAHGGGRAMSRAAAARSISQKQLHESMTGVLCAHDGLLLDEAPDAYKDIRTVMRGQNDLIKILYDLHPVVSIKGR
jgi:tRNA-splicing ligase RtcB